MLLTKKDYDIISNIVFKLNYPGFTPNIIESPNGDKNWDNLKQYAHISPKYLNQCNDGEDKDILNDYYYKCIEDAIKQYKVLGLSKTFYPGPDSTLRILKYPIGATTAPHTDFDLFTLSIYRNIKETFKYLDGNDIELLIKARNNSDGIHFGELITEILNVPCTKHEVIACDQVQESIVFFVIPNHECILPNGVTVGNWINERKSRSRKVI